MQIGARGHWKRYNNQNHFAWLEKLSSQARVFVFKELKIVGKSLLNEIDEMMRKYLIQLVSQNLDDVRKSKDWLNDTLLIWNFFAK